VPLERDQAHYLSNVLRLGNNDSVLAFNGRDGEWRCRLEGRKAAMTLRPEEQTRDQPPNGGPQLCFAPLKHARLDYMVQKAVEMGAGLLQPVLTRRTQAARVNEDRMRANAIEAAEQCGILAVPEVRGPQRFEALLASWDPGRLMVFCDEDAEVTDPVAALRGAAGETGLATPAVSVLIGPSAAGPPPPPPSLARPTDPAGRYGGGGGADAGSIRTRRRQRHGLMNRLRPSQ